MSLRHPVSKPLVSLPRRPFLRRSLVTLTACIFLCAGLMAAPARAEIGEPEKEDLRFGFIKLTDMSPLAIAYEKGFFEDEGLYVTLEAQANWKVLLQRTVSWDKNTPLR